jgi:hypothetical protein
MKQVTVRNVSPELDKRLTALARARKKSVNAVVLEILEKAVGIDERRERLRRYMTWTREDREAFDAVLREQREIDEDAWK